MLCWLPPACDLRQGKSSALSVPGLLPASCRRLKDAPSARQRCPAWTAGACISPLSVSGNSGRKRVNSGGKRAHWMLDRCRCSSLHPPAEDELAGGHLIGAKTNTGWKRSWRGADCLASQRTTARAGALAVSRMSCRLQPAARPTASSSAAQRSQCAAPGSPWRLHRAGAPAAPSPAAAVPALAAAQRRPQRSTRRSAAAVRAVQASASQAASTAALPRTPAAMVDQAAAAVQTALDAGRPLQVSASGLSCAGSLVQGS